MGSVHSAFLQFSPNDAAKKSVHLLPNPLVRTDKGPVEGKRHRLKDGRLVDVFLGIPFAKPPMGPLRFKKPEEPDPWGPTPLATRRYKPRAIQRDFFWDTLELKRVPKSEDCLHLNVMAPAWEPPANSSSGWPVMVYIHGGGYMMDSAVKYHYAKVAQNLVRHGVIVVTIQYRLGLLGFLCSGDDECPGNLGLWDQLFALRWVNRNIAAFGGDPGRVTLFGHSAGAASIDLLSLSPLSRHLFQQMILMGGSAETMWALSAKEVLVQHCRRKARQLGFRPSKEEGQWDREESRRMLDFLRSLPAEKFELTMLGDRKVLNELRLAVSPVIDGELLPKSPKELRAESPVKRVICGQSRHEGLLFLALGMRRANGKLLAYCEQQIQQLMSRAKQNLPTDEIVPQLEEIRQLYGLPSDSKILAGNKPEMQRICVAMMSDLVNNLAMHNFCRSITQKPGAHVWHFLFDHFNPDSSRALNRLLPFKASTHGNELHYVFDINFFVLPWRRTQADRAVLDMTTRWWTNFAKYGDPNGQSGAEMPSAVEEGTRVASQPPSLLYWEALSPENMERHLIIAKEPRMRDGTAESKRVQRLAPAYRALIQ